MPEITESTAHSQEGNWFSLAASLHKLESIDGTTEISLDRRLVAKNSVEHFAIRNDVTSFRTSIVLLLVSTNALAPVT